MRLHILAFLTATLPFLNGCLDDSSSSDNPPVTEKPPAIEEPPIASGELRLFGGGNQMCGLNSDGEVFCWGKSANGEMGIPKLAPRQEQETTAISGTLTPTKVANLPSITTLTADYSHTCGIDDGGLLWCWGKDYTPRVIGDPDSFENNDTPYLVDSLQGLKQVYTSQDSICANNSSQTLWCWGRNDSAHLNTGSTDTYIMQPSLFNWSDIEKTNKIAMASSSICILANDGNAHCMGFNWGSALGTGSEEESVDSLEAVIMPNGVSFTQLAAGFRSYCGLGNNHKVYCWGHYDDEREKMVSVPTQVQGDANFETISMNQEGGCGISDEKKVYCWGENNSGLFLEKGTGEWVNSPRHIELGGNVLNLATAEFYSCAQIKLQDGNEIKCWGSIASENFLDHDSGDANRQYYGIISLTSP